MTAAAPRAYDRAVAAVRDALRRAAASLALLIGFLHPAVAQAASGSFTMGDQAVVQVWAGARSMVTIRSWDRPNVQFETDDEAAEVNRRSIAFGTPQTPLSVSIPLANITVRDPGGGTAPGTLPPEEFPYASDFRAGVHDAVRIVTHTDSRITVMVPASVAILDTRIVRGSGAISIDGYHGGTLFVSSSGGRMFLTNVMSAAFIQMMNGALVVSDSSFDRVRARSNNANLIFEHDRARQIEVTTVSGTIVYDNGTFDPGLARFDSTNGSIAIGVAGGAQLAARSTDGHVYSMWEKRTPIAQRSDGEASATVAGGGPVVNAVSAHGNVFIYDGTLDTRHTLPAEWQVVRDALRPRQPQAPGAFERYKALRGRTL
jgi:Putative adhesin